MAILKVISPTPCNSTPDIEQKVLELLKFIRENKTYQIAFVAIYDDPDNAEQFKFYRDYADTQDYDLENLIDGLEEICDKIIDVEDEKYEDAEEDE